MPIPDPDLAAAVLAALGPQGPRDRLFRLLYPGLSARQVLGRLPDAMRQDLLAVSDSEMIGRREALDRVSRALYGHVDAGRVTRSRRRLHSAMVDCFALDRGARRRG